MVLLLLIQPTANPVVSIYWSGPAQSRPLLFKGQPYSISQTYLTLEPFTLEITVELPSVLSDYLLIKPN